METNAKHVLIGIFALVGIATVLGFFAWLARVEISGQTAYYNIDFEESVAGLSIGGDVRYRGIKVGTVSSMQIHPQNPLLARITVEIGSTPLREGDRATLVLQGITGVLFVNVEGAGPGSPLLTAAPGEPLPLIPSEPSAIAAIFEGTPNLMTQAAVVLDKTATLLDEVASLTGGRNEQLIRGILEDLQGITTSVTAREQAFGRIVGSFDRSSDDLEEGMAELRATLKHAERLFSTDLPPLIEEYQSAGASVRRLADDAGAVLAENREPLRQLSGETLAKLNQVTIEANRLLARLSRLTERLESEGLSTLAGSAPRELELEDRR